jgi:hypothetical protein
MTLRLFAKNFVAYTEDVLVPRVNGTFGPVLGTKVRHWLHLDILVHVPNEQRELVSGVDGKVRGGLEGRQ